MGEAILVLAAHQGEGRLRFSSPQGAMKELGCGVVQPPSESLAHTLLAAASRLARSHIHAG